MLATGNESHSSIIINAANDIHCSNKLYISLLLQDSDNSKIVKLVYFESSTLMAKAIVSPIAPLATDVATANVQVTVVSPSSPSVPAVVLRRPRSATIKQGYLVKKVSWMSGEREGMGDRVLRVAYEG